jgi:hypothetical protein
MVKPMMPANRNIQCLEKHQIITIDIATSIEPQRNTILSDQPSAVKIPAVRDRVASIATIVITARRWEIEYRHSTGVPLRLRQKLLRSSTHSAIQSSAACVP